MSADPSSVLRRRDVLVRVSAALGLPEVPLVTALFGDDVPPPFEQCAVGAVRAASQALAVPRWPGVFVSGLGRKARSAFEFAGTLVVLPRLAEPLLLCEDKFAHTDAIVRAAVFGCCASLLRKMQVAPGRDAAVDAVVSANVGARSRSDALALLRELPGSGRCALLCEVSFQFDSDFVAGVWEKIDTKGVMDFWGAPLAVMSTAALRAIAGSYASKDAPVEQEVADALMLAALARGDDRLAAQVARLRREGVPESWTPHRSDFEFKLPTLSEEAALSALILSPSSGAALRALKRVAGPSLALSTPIGVLKLILFAFPHAACFLVSKGNATPEKALVLLRELLALLPPKWPWEKGDDGGDAVRLRTSLFCVECVVAFDCVEFAEALSSFGRELRSKGGVLPFPPESFDAALALARSDALLKVRPRVLGRVLSFVAKRHPRDFKWSVLRQFARQSAAIESEPQEEHGERFVSMACKLARIPEGAGGAALLRALFTWPFPREAFVISERSSPYIARAALVGAFTAALEGNARSAMVLARVASASFASTEPPCSLVQEAIGGEMQFARKWKQTPPPPQLEQFFAGLRLETPRGALLGATVGVLAMSAGWEKRPPLRLLGVSSIAAVTTPEAWLHVAADVWSADLVREASREALRAAPWLGTKARRALVCFAYPKRTKPPEAPRREPSHSFNLCF